MGLQDGLVLKSGRDCIKATVFGDCTSQTYLYLFQTSSHLIKITQAFSTNQAPIMSTRTFLGNLELGSGSFVIPSPAERPLAYIVTAFMFLLVIYNTTSQKKANVPELNPPKSRVRLPGYVSAEQAQDFTRNSKDLMVAGRAKYPDQAYRLYSYLGDAIIIPPNLVNEIRNEHSLDFQASSSIVSQRQALL